MTPNPPERASSVTVEDDARGTDPALARERARVHALARVALAAAFLWHGLVPKLLVHHPDEVAMQVDAGVPARLAARAVTLVGWAEVAWGVLLLVLWRARWPFPATVAALALAQGVVTVYSPRFLTAAFTPVTLNAALVALAIIGWLASARHPSPARSPRTEP